MEEPFKNEKFDIKIERAKLEDWEKFKKIRLEALGQFQDAFGNLYEDEEKKTDQEWQKEISKGDYIILLAQKGRDPVGLSKFKHRRFGGRHTWTISSVFVKESYQGQKIGEQIMRATEEAIRQKGGKRAVLYINPNSTVRSFYEKLGYTFMPGRSAKSKDSRIWERMEKILVD